MDWRKYNQLVIRRRENKLVEFRQLDSVLSSSRSILDQDTVVLLENKYRRLDRKLAMY